MWHFTFRRVCIQLFNEVATSHPRSTGVLILSSEHNFHTHSLLPLFYPPTSLGRRLFFFFLHLRRGRATKIFINIPPTRKMRFLSKDKRHYLSCGLGSVLHVLQRWSPWYVKRNLPLKGVKQFTQVHEVQWVHKVQPKKGQGAASKTHVPSLPLLHSSKAMPSNTLKPQLGHTLNL